MTYDFIPATTPGFYVVSLGREFKGTAARRSSRKGHKGFWTFQPVGKSALLRTFRTKNEIAKWLSSNGAA